MFILVDEENGGVMFFQAVNYIIQPIIMILWLIIPMVLIYKYNKIPIRRGEMIKKTQESEKQVEELKHAA